jgi:hypothetical protein
LTSRLELQNRRGSVKTATSTKANALWLAPALIILGKPTRTNLMQIKEFDARMDQYFPDILNVLSLEIASCS